MNTDDTNAIIAHCTELCNLAENMYCIYDILECAEILYKMLSILSYDFYCIDVISCIGKMLVNLENTPKFLDELNIFVCIIKKKEHFNDKPRYAK